MRISNMYMDMLDFHVLEVDVCNFVIDILNLTNWGSVWSYFFSFFFLFADPMEMDWGLANGQDLPTWLLHYP